MSCMENKISDQIDAGLSEREKFEKAIDLMREPLLKSWPGEYGVTINQFNAEVLAQVEAIFK